MDRYDFEEVDGILIKTEIPVYTLGGRVKTLPPSHFYI
jgi:hypothetical protein